jgi:hypothetical protein
LKILLLISFILIIPIISNSTIVRANDENLPSDFSEIYHLEYLILFAPIKDHYSTTKYALNLENYEIDGENYTKVSAFYEDIDLTFLRDNITYIISQSSRMITEVSKVEYDDYIKGTHTELLLNISNFNSSQKFRIDETLTFSNYFNEYQSSGSIRSDVSFNYMGIENINTNSAYNFTTHHFNAQHIIWSEGDY